MRSVKRRKDQSLSEMINLFDSDTYSATKPLRYFKGAWRDAIGLLHTDAVSDIATQAIVSLV